MAGAVSVATVIFLATPGSAAAHGTRGPNHVHMDGIGTSVACVELPDRKSGGNPLGYYKRYKVYPSADFKANGRWHQHNVSWDNQGHIVGGPAIGTYTVCGM